MPLYLTSALFFIKRISFITISLLPLCLYSQPIPDTSKTISMGEIVVKAFALKRNYKLVPASVVIADSSILNRYSSFSIVKALNSLPGVKMEERSPGSYRFNIRGSSLRSPFGVRNVKVYYNDIPFTDPGGQTYINQLGFYNFAKIEILKGLGNSVYGSGTGGVLLIDAFGNTLDPMIKLEYSKGSYNANNVYVAFSTTKKRAIHKLGVQIQDGEGYRVHSALNRKVFSWIGNFNIETSGILKTTVFYGDLFYQTPGALTFQEFANDPKAARPAAGSNPSAVEAKASVHQRSFIAGASYFYKPGKKFEHTILAYGALANLKNPTLRNYGRTSEPHVGSRTLLSWTDSLFSRILTIKLGGEWQEGFTTVSIHANNKGNPDTLQTIDDIDNRQRFIFLQTSFESKGWITDVGISVNWYSLKFIRVLPLSNKIEKKNINGELAPRISLGKKLNKYFFYTSLAKGFSPPTTSELLPTGSSINLDLKPEIGINLEVGGRTSFKRLFADLTGFIFHLSNTIVQRRDASGGEQYINAGKTFQSGIEMQLIYQVGRNNKSVNGTSWLSYSLYNFKYKEFQQLNNDYSGMKLPGIPTHNLATGLNISFGSIFSSISYQYDSKFPLDDANSAFSMSSHILNFKFGLRLQIHGRFDFIVTGGIDNILNEKYSLGYDLNGFSGRYYNPASGRNYFITAGLSLN